MTVTVHEASAMRDRLAAKGVKDDEVCRMFGAYVIITECPAYIGTHYFPTEKAEQYRTRLKELGELE